MDAKIFVLIYLSIVFLVVAFGIIDIRIKEKRIIKEIEHINKDDLWDGFISMANRFVEDKEWITSLGISSQITILL